MTAQAESDIVVIELCDRLSGSVAANDSLRAVLVHLSPVGKSFRKENKMLNMGMGPDYPEWRYNMVVEDVQEARQFAAFVTKHLPAALGRLLQPVKVLIVSLASKL